MSARTQPIESKAPSDEPSPLFALEKCDFENPKLQGPLSTPLEEDKSKFVEVQEEDFKRSKLAGVSEHVGLYIKPGDVPEKRWVKHAESRSRLGDEYFAFQVLRVLDICTPTTRVCSGEEFYTSSTHIPIMPNIALLSDNVRVDEKKAPELKKLVEEHPEFKRVSETYKLDPVRQMIIHRANQTEHKIRGNFFGAPIAAVLLADPDFQFTGGNFGVVPRDSHSTSFHAAAIDKSDVDFDVAEAFDYLEKNAHAAITDPLFGHATLEQKLYCLYKVHLAVSTGEFYKIFNNDSLNITPALKNYAGGKDKNLIHNATLILKHYEVELGANYLTKFAKREKMRSDLADKVIAQLNFPKPPSASYIANLKEMIMSDLRASYYEKHFLDIENKQISQADLENTTLINAITFEVTKELFPALVLPLVNVFLLQKKAEHSKPKEQFIISPTSAEAPESPASALSPSSPRSPASPASPKSATSAASPKGSHFTLFSPMASPRGPASPSSPRGFAPATIPTPSDSRRKQAFQRIEDVVAKVENEEKNLDKALAIIKGCIITEAEEAQRIHLSQLVTKKKESAFTTLMYRLLDQLGYSPKDKAACMDAYNEMIKPTPPGNRAVSP